MYQTTHRRLAACPECGASFETPRPAQVYCCGGCQRRAEAKRNASKAEYAAPAAHLDRGVMWVQDGTSGAVLIGATGPSTRTALGRLQAGNPSELTLRLLLRGAGKDVAAALSDHFATDNVRGAWFQASAELLYALRWFADNGREVTAHRAEEAYAPLATLDEFTRLSAETRWESWVTECDALQPWCPERVAPREEPRRRRVAR